MSANSEKPIDPTNEAERINADIDRLITNPEDREKLKKSFKENYLLMQFFFRSETDHDIGIEERVTDIVMKKMREIHLRDNEQLCSNVAEIVIAQNKTMFDKLDAMARSVSNVEKSIQGINIKIDTMDGQLNILKKQVFETDEKRLRKLEKYASLGWTILRNIITGLLAIGISILVFFQIHNHLK